MLRKHLAIVLFAAITLAACNSGDYDSRTGENQTDTGAAGTNDMNTEQGTSRERDMDTRTGDIGTRSRPGTESDTDVYGTSPGTGSVPEETSPGTSDQGTGMDDTTGATGGGSTGTP